MADPLALPSPSIIEGLDYEAILGALMADVRDRFAGAGIDYDVGHLETDPVKIVLEAAAYREMLLRARVNDAAKANLVAFSEGTDLDHLAAFYDVARLQGELDEALRERVILAISGRSTAGPRDWYRAAARRASDRVKDAAVYRIGLGPDIRVAVLATDNYGEPDAALLAAVRNVVTSDAVRVISDRIEVIAATSTTVDLAADAWLLPDAPQTVFDGLEDGLRAALAAQGGLGFDVTRSWLVATLHQPGVQKVVLHTPASDAVVGDNAAATLGTVALTYKGRGR
ncbi:baseplate assembly protein [Aquamicrobium terrae]